MQTTITADDVSKMKTKLLEHSSLACAQMHEDYTVKSLLATYFAALLLTSETSCLLVKQSYHYCPGYESGQRIECMGPKVFRIKEGGDLATDDHVTKVFDYVPHCICLWKLNIDAWKTALPSFGEHISEKYIPGCSSVRVLATPLFPGSHRPTQLEHVALLCDQLASLHSKKMMHGDVLCQNICFWSTDDECMTALIDYDYSHLPDYPPFWNTKFAERHPDSVSGEYITEGHDVYSTIAILCMHFHFKEGEETQELWGEFASGAFAAEKHPNLLPAWISASAEKLATWIRDNSSKIIRKDPPVPKS